MKVNGNHIYQGIRFVFNTHIHIHKIHEKAYISARNGNLA